MINYNRAGWINSYNTCNRILFPRNGIDIGPVRISNRRGGFNEKERKKIK